MFDVEQPRWITHDDLGIRVHFAVQMLRVTSDVSPTLKAEQQVREGSVMTQVLPRRIEDIGPDMLRSTVISDECTDDANAFLLCENA